LRAFSFFFLSTSALLTTFLAVSPGDAQTAPPGEQTKPRQGALPPIEVSGHRPKHPARSRRPGRPFAIPGPQGEGPSSTASSSTTLGAAGTTPLNTNVVAGSASRLGLTVRQTPATIEVVDQQTMQEQGYRTSAEVAKGAVGVLDVDSAGAPANFSMRGFTFGEVNILYNGISIGVGSDTARILDTYDLAQVEFLKGPSALMSGLNAIGGSVNYVSRQLTTGPIQNEMDLSIDTQGTFRSHYGSGGSTAVPGLDYRFDVTGSKINSFIDGDYRDLGDLSAQVNYRVNDAFKTFAAVEYKSDTGHAYWGTPLVPTSLAGSHAVNNVVSGNAFSTFAGDNLGPVTIDGRTLATNYNVADNATGAHELWLRSGFEWTPLNNVTVKDQVYYYQAQRNWLDSETYAFDDGAVFAPGVIDRDRFFVTHNQHVVGDNLDFLWDSRVFGMDNRLAAQLQVSGNWITFVEEGDPNDYPYDFVSVTNPSAGLYGPQFPDTRIRTLSDVAAAFEDRLKITPEFALIGGIRRRLYDHGQWRRLRWFDSLRAVHSDVAAGLLSRGLHLRTDPQADVLQHVCHVLRSGGRRCLLCQSQLVTGAHQRADL
jgi:iron complex outermembrane recepter protein